ncbi:TetR/AcrR family transcriptional regulator [Lapillicoccus jejuensis]|uniref:TetR family transcriptional regulator n=1 Tax=Lapillicoccus jejuensis TaxID=402171 RepID=A0A542E3Q1_9MICO|nr:TetR/AcrR family transcriptional regulator [Lapillicoccus jejuensis]TQJ09961.1 TetR family transcriptional regulator [Lapillicoccus jejuensis]
MTSTPDIRHDRAPDEIGMRLVDEAARLLAEHGPSGLSLRRVAAASGTSTMAVYTRFGDKQGLLAAMYREGFRRLGARLAEAAQPPDLQAPLPGLAAVGRAYRESALASPFLYALMFGPHPAVAGPGPDGGAAIAEAAEATYRPLEAGVREAVAGGLLVGDPARIARHLWTVAHGAVSLELSGRLAPDEDPAALYDDALLLAALPFLAG